MRGVRGRWCSFMTGVPEVKLFGDRAAAVQLWLHEQRAGFDLQNDVAEDKIRAERHLSGVAAGDGQSRRSSTVAQGNG